jgi:hypothetical protein
VRWSRARAAAAALLALAAAAGCAGLPQPYRGRPGGDAQRLAMPLAVRIAVPPPEGALLADASARRLSEAVAEALQGQEVPAVATDAPWPLDWRVEIGAEALGSAVRPRFRLLDADRRPQAATEGAAVPVQEWSNPSPELLRRVATQAAPNLARLLLQVDAARKAIDPAALAAGPPRLRFLGVRGAPGDGNTSLATRMREFLGNQGFVVQDTADGATYGLEGAVAVAPPARGVQRVEIVWTVTRRDGEDLGRVAQLNEVPNGRLNGLWGDIAYAAAEEAAGGVRTVVANAVAPPAPESGAAAPSPLVPPVGAAAGEAAPLPPPRVAAGASRAAAPVQAAAAAGAAPGGPVAPRAAAPPETARQPARPGR